MFPIVVRNTTISLSNGFVPLSANPSLNAMLIYFKYDLQEQTPV